MINAALILAAILFMIGFVGLLFNRNSLIHLLMSIELMLLAVNFNLVAFNHAHQHVSGDVFVFFVLTVAAAESAIGLALLLCLFRKKQSIWVDDINQLKG